MPITFVETGAQFDQTRRYRYTLWRAWKKSPSRWLNFVMLNPSTADESVLDPTVTRCMNFAHDWGFDGAYVTNLFALRSTDPRALYADPSPIGPQNDEYILDIARMSKRVIVAWGVHGKLSGRGADVAHMLQKFDPQCFALTKDGCPRHPLYLRRDSQLMPFTVTELAVAHQA